MNLEGEKKLETMTTEIVYMHLLCMFVYPSIDIIEKYEIHLIPNKGYSKKKKQITNLIQTIPPFIAKV
jgi:hypothetical protein